MWCDPEQIAGLANSWLHRKFTKSNQAASCSFFLPIVRSYSLSAFAAAWTDFLHANKQVQLKTRARVPLSDNDFIL